MLESGTTQQLFANRVVDDRKYNEAKNALIFIQEQHRDIMQVCIPSNSPYENKKQFC